MNYIIYSFLGEGGTNMNDLKQNAICNKFGQIFTMMNKMWILQRKQLSESDKQVNNRSQSKKRAQEGICIRL